MKAFGTFCKAFGFVAIGFALLLAVLGEIGIGVMMLAVGGLLIWLAPKVANYKKPFTEPELRSGTTPVSEIPQDPDVWLTKGQRKKREIAERKQAAAAQGIACCPKCGSTSLSANKKGFSAGKAAAGMFAVGLGGAVFGAAGANKIKVTCLNCGYQFKPGKK